ncbi:hypothetical protein ElyMa_006558600 [Elysia marginata]|uniref:Uncharacterized protein n=1 Tax=Elysia marginata TaxID=1093978 RepID=A0AAV4I915_9GAST|nr:hypothetical protein ElyMa_006558600 [Elysia marginata]
MASGDWDHSGTKQYAVQTAGFDFTTCVNEVALMLRSGRLHCAIIECIGMAISAGAQISDLVSTLANSFGRYDDSDLPNDVRKPANTDTPSPTPKARLEKGFWPRKYQEKWGFYKIP